MLNATHNYLVWNKTSLSNLTTQEIQRKYEEGYVFTRTGKGDMVQTRSLRVGLKDFTLTSENRRILRKHEDVELSGQQLPISEGDYDWHIHKMGSDFYVNKFGEGVFSANTLKALMTNPTRSNFNFLFKYGSAITINSSDASELSSPEVAESTLARMSEALGYCVCYVDDAILHYAYPFYDLKTSKLTSLGMAMMLKAILFAQKEGKDHVYLGSVRQQSDRYKLQFNNLEWFDGEKWQTDLENLKTLIRV